LDGDEHDFSRYWVLFKVQAQARKLASNLPKLPPSFLIGVQLIVARLLGLHLSRAMELTEQNIRNALAVREGDAFLDVGASIGGWSTWASKLVGETGVVVAIEPNELAFEWLRKNLGRARNVVALRAAACSSNRAIDLWTVNNSMSSMTDKDVIQRYEFDLSKGRPIKMKGVRLDSLTQYLRADQEIVMKIDVEGAEVDALTGAIGILAQTRMLAVEVHSEALATRVDQFLSDQGFSTRFLAMKGQYPAHIIGTRLSSV
jgi:FkbM family methyltransferase